MSYRTDDCTSSAATSTPRAVPYAVPLDPTLQSRSLQPLGVLQYNRPYASLGFAKAAATLALPSPDGTNDELKLEALRQLLDALVRPESVSAVLGPDGVFAELMINAANPSAAVRVLAMQALAAVTRARAGREFAIAADVTPRLANRAEMDREPNAQVRRNALQCLLNIAASAPGILHLLSHNIPRQLIGKLASESDLATHALCAHTLAEMVREPRAWSDAVAEKIVPTCFSVLQAKVDLPETQAAAQRVRESASQQQQQDGASSYTSAGVVATSDKAGMDSLEHLCRLIAHIAAPSLSGKDACVSERGSVSLLVGLVAHPVAQVREEASFALQHVTNCESGKRAALGVEPKKECDALEALIQAALDEPVSPLVQAQCLQSITNLAEHPVAKTDERLLGALDRIKQLAAGHEDQQVRHAAQMAVDQITWQP